MSAYQCWVAQRERLRENLQTTGDASGAAYLTRHALAQVEQNAMAELNDDLLRQQMGILFSCCKISLNLLDISITTKVWVAQPQAGLTPKSNWGWAALAAVVLQALAGYWAYAKELTGVWVLLISALGLAVFSLLVLRHSQRSQPIPEDRMKVTAKPDAEKLFSAIDAQMRAVDRYMNDFAYLNEQNALQGNTPDPRNTVLLAELMEATYACEGDAGEDVATAAEHLLGSLGVRAMPYEAAQSKLFTVLPSLNSTRTLVPALVSTKDGALLHRGTAAVMDMPDNRLPLTEIDAAQPQRSRE